MSGNGQKMYSYGQQKNVPQRVFLTNCSGNIIRQNEISVSLAMRHIINIIGPPAVGKTTVIREMQMLLPFYEVLAIDDFRRRVGISTSEQEHTAWNQLWLSILKAEYCFVESNGTSPLLGMMLDRLWRAPGTNILTVALRASPKICRERQQQRSEVGNSELPSSASVGQKWIPISEVSISMSIDTSKHSPAQIAAQLLKQLPADFQ